MASLLSLIIRVLLAILVFLILVLFLNKLLVSMEKRGTITSTVKRRIYTVSVFVLGLLTLLVILHMLYTYVFFLYLFLIIIAVSIASTYPLLNNFYAYIALVNTRQLLSGSYVRLGKLKGRVKGVGYIFTRVLLDDESTVYIPNNYLLKRPFIVYKPYGRIRALVTLTTQGEVDIESIADKIEEGIRKGFRHLSPDSEITVTTQQATETNITFEVSVEYSATEVRAKILNNFIETLYSNLYEFSPSIKIVKD